MNEGRMKKGRNEGRKGEGKKKRRIGERQNIWTHPNMDGKRKGRRHGKRGSKEGRETNEGGEKEEERKKGGHEARTLRRGFSVAGARDGPCKFFIGPPTCKAPLNKGDP